MSLRGFEGPWDIQSIRCQKKAIIHSVKILIQHLLTLIPFFYIGIILVIISCSIHRSVHAETQDTIDDRSNREVSQVKLGCQHRSIAKQHTATNNVRESPLEYLVAKYLTLGGSLLRFNSNLFSHRGKNNDI